ncbi:deoxycytidylate deaminase-like isoform X4 [Alosa alosa]|uniref:deoxycytidylate deaminase-like isoform X4 n=1 Tax=Alosa alosa TaxID=278164 RepID=UPI0020151DF3|nr:deoxycytidylate deaminase-like isoform X4 [Alosa alosa]
MQNKMEDQEYFMAVAFLAAKQSPDTNSKVGACIVNTEKKIVGIGYNRMPIGCPAGSLPWARDNVDPLNNKYMYVCHAELNAIMNKNSADVKGCTIYVSLFPCNECTKIIIQSGIKDVIYLSDKYHNKTEVIASKRMLDLAGIPYSTAYNGFWGSSGAQTTHSAKWAPPTWASTCASTWASTWAQTFSFAAASVQIHSLTRLVCRAVLWALPSPIAGSSLTARKCWTCAGRTCDLAMAKG